MRSRSLALVAAFALAVGLIAAACDPPPPTSDFPNASTTGADETAITSTIDHTITVTTPGTTIENVRFTNCADLFVAAENVTVRNVVFEGGRLENNVEGAVHNGMLVDHDTFTNLPGERHNSCDDHVFYRVGTGGYAARAVRIDRQQEGFRIGGKSLGGTDVNILDSFVLIDTYGDARWNGTSWVPDEGTNHVLVSDPNSPDDAPCDGHPDGVQGFDGPTGNLLHNTFDEASYGPGTCNNAAMFITDGSDGGDVFNNLGLGGGYTDRFHTGTYRLDGNRVARTKADLGGDPLWGFGPLNCNHDPGETHVVTQQADNSIVAVDADYHVTAVLDSLPAC